VIGSDIEIGSPLSDGVGACDVDALGVDTGAGAALTAGAGAGGGVTVAVVGVVTLGTVTVVGVVAAPDGTTPANTVVAARTRPPAATAAEERKFRLNVLLHSVYGLHRPALSPRLSLLYPPGETTKPP
jgi:hypothetical protein